MGIYILASGNMIEQMVKEDIFQIMELNMMENGKMINKKDMGNKNGKMEQFIKEVISKVKNKEKVPLYGEMIVHMKVISMIIIFMVMGNMYGKMEEFIKEIGIIIRCMEKEFLYGLMAVNIRANILMTRSMDLVYFSLKMGDCMKVSGKKENNMVEENLERKI